MLNVTLEKKYDIYSVLSKKTKRFELRHRRTFETEPLLPVYTLTNGADSTSVALWCLLDHQYQPETFTGPRCWV